MRRLIIIAAAAVLLLSLGIVIMLQEVAPTDPQVAGPTDPAAEPDDPEEVTPTDPAAEPDDPEEVTPTDPEEVAPTDPEEVAPTEEPLTLVFTADEMFSFYFVCYERDDCRIEFCECFRRQSESLRGKIITLSATKTEVNFSHCRTTGNVRGGNIQFHASQKTLEKYGEKTGWSFSLPIQVSFMEEKDIHGLPPITITKKEAQEIKRRSEDGKKISFTGLYSGLGIIVPVRP